MAPRTKTKAKTTRSKQVSQPVLSPEEQYKQTMLERRNELRRLQGIPEHK